MVPYRGPARRGPGPTGGTVRTLVISDLHLGSLLERDVLRRPIALEALEAQVAGVDRLVLLGDTLELLDDRPADALAVASEVLPVLAGALGKTGSVVLVAGNHDRALVRPWLRERLRAGAPIAPARRVPRRASPLLEKVCALLRPANVEVRYPGVWLGPRVYATHGHYVDRHLLASLRGGDVAARSAVADYERSTGIDSGALQELLATALPEQLAGGAEALIGRARRTVLASVPLIGAAPGMRGASLVWATLLEHGVTRRGAIPAMVRVARDLSVDADVLVFGHIHRRGPLPSDDPHLWRPEGSAGARLINTGCWVWDPALVGRGPGPRPYRPGGAVLIDGDRVPKVLDLLKGVPGAKLRGRV